MNKLFMTALAVFASRLFKGFEKPDHSLLGISQLKMSLFYIKGIKTLRLLFIGIVGLGISLVLLLVGLIVLNITIFSYAPLTAQTKMYVGFFMAFIYSAAAGAIFYYVFSQDTWMSMFHAQDVINEISDEINPSTANQENIKTEKNTADPYAVV